MPPASSSEAEKQVIPFQAVIESFTDGLIVLDRDYRCTYTNSAAATFLRTTPDKLIGQIIWDMIAQPRYPQLHEGIARAAEQKVFVRFEEYCEVCGHWYEWRCYPSDSGLTIFFDDATEHKRVEEELRSSEERYRKLFEANLAGVYLTKLDGTIIDFNDTMMKMLGYDLREEVCQHNSSDFYADPEFRKYLIYLLQRDGIVPGKEALLQRKDGAPLYAIGAAVLLTDDRTGERYIQGVAVDITDRRKMEEELRLTEARFRALFEQSPLSIQILSLDGRTVQINRAWEQLWGVMGLTYDLKDWSILQDQQIEAKGIMPYIQKGFAGEATETPVILYDPAETGCPGRPRWLKAYIYPIKGETGQILQVVVTHVDVTELIETEKALKESEERLSLAVEATGLGTFDFYPQTGELLWSDTGKQHFGLSPHAHADYDVFLSGLHPEDRERVDQCVYSALNPESGGKYETEYRTIGVEDGLERWIHAQGRVYFDELGNPVRFIGATLDITERKKAQEALARSLTDLEFLSVSATHYLEAMPSGELLQYTAQQLQAAAGNAVIVVCEYEPGTNQAIVRALGGPQDKLRKLPALLGRDPLGMAFIVSQDTREGMARGRLERVEGGIYDLSFHEIPLDLSTLIERELHLGDIYLMPFYLGDDFMGTVTVSTDLAEGLQNRELIEAIVNQAALALKRTRTEEALRANEQALRDLTTTLEIQVARRTAELEHRARQLQKLMLELTQTEDRERKRVAEILHDDLQQILAAAKFHLGLLGNGTKGPEESREIATQVKYMLKDAIEKSRSLSHELSPAVLYQSDLGDTFTWLARQMQQKYGLTVHLDIRGPVDLQSEPLRALLYKATQELLFNVVKHARTSEAGVRLRRLGGYVCLSVWDRGRGFDQEQLREIIGFGLLSIQERVRLLGGRMKIKTTKGRGSTFHIVVPCSELPGQAAQVEQPLEGREEAGRQAQAEGDGRLRVLLADDHEIVRQGMASLLSEQPNLEVVGQASNGREAVNLTYQLRPDVVVMDVSMPLMSGAEATRQIKRHVPGTRVVALSMYDEVETIERMHEAGAESYVLKTAPSDELLAAIQGK